MYVDWILVIGVILIVCLLYAIYVLVQPQLAPEGFAPVQTPNQQYTIPALKGVTGRYVRIRPSLDPRADGYLTISQIQVFDINGSNVAIKRPVTATSRGGSPVDKRYGMNVVIGNVYRFQPGVSDGPACIVDGTTIPRDGLTNVFETSVQNACSGTSQNCSPAVTTDTEYVEIDLGQNTLISSIVYTGRRDADTRTIQTIDGDSDYLTQVDRVKGVRIEVYSAQRAGGPLSYTSGLNYSTSLPTTDTVQTIIIPSNMYGVNIPTGSAGSGSSLPMTTVAIPNIASLKNFLKPLQNYKLSTLPRKEDVGVPPTLLAYAPMIAGIKSKYSGVDIDLSNNIFLPIIMDSPLNFYYDLYKQSGCNPVCLQGAGCRSTTDCTTHAGVQYCPPTYCTPTGPLPSFNETLDVNIFGTASDTAVQEMRQSIEYCKVLYLGSPPAIENFIRVNFSYTDMTAMKAYLRGDNPCTASSGGSGSCGSSVTTSNGLPPPSTSFCVPDIVQKFRSGSFITTFSVANNSWNATHCRVELTPTVLGLIPFVSRNFIVQWVANRTIRYKHFINMLTTNLSYALEDLNAAKADLAAAQQGITDSANPANFTVEEKNTLAVSAAVALFFPLFNPITVFQGIIIAKAIMATFKRDKAKTAVDDAQNNYNSVQSLLTAGNNPVTVPEVATRLQIPSYISINSKTVIDSIAQQFYELMGGQFNMSYIYDILPLGSTMLDIRFELYIHDSFSSTSAPINDLKAQYKRIKTAAEVSKDILDQAAVDYDKQLSTLEASAAQSFSNPFQGAVARLFYTKVQGSITITGIIFDDRAVTSFLPELNGGIPVPLGPSPGNVNYKPTVAFTKNQLEPLDCTNPDTLRRIFDDYISIVNDPQNNYPLLAASPPLDVKKGDLYVTSVIGATQLTPTSCSLTWTETLYDANTNLPMSSSSGGGSNTVITRSATFLYRGDTSIWYSSELTIDKNGITFLSSSTGITALTPPITFIKPLPTRMNLDNLSNICPTTSCEDPDVLFSLVDQYNSDPTLPGSILTVTHAYTPNPNQCDVKVSINYDSEIQDIVGQDTTDPVTGVTTTSYGNVKKGAVTYETVNNALMKGSKSMPYTGVKKDITIAMYVAIDPATCGYTLSDASGQNTGTSIQPNTPALFTPMIYTKEVVKRNATALGSSIDALQQDYTQALGSTRQTLKSYRIQEYNALNKIFSSSGLASCSSAKCGDASTLDLIKDYYKTTIGGNTGVQIKTIMNTAQIDKNVCEATFNTNSVSALVAYKFIFNTSSCSIASASPIMITGPTDDQILDITKEMNAGVTEAFVPSRRVESEAIGMRGFGRDGIRNYDAAIKDTQFTLPLKQQEERKPRHVPPSYRFLRFIPTATRGGSTVNVGKFTFFYEDDPLLVNGSVTNPMGTWEGSITDVTGPGPRPGWSDAHKRPLVFAFRDSIAIDAYSFTTALPEAGIEGDPISWKLEGSSNGTFWTILDTQKNYPTPVRRFSDMEKIYLV
jgi:hypothetical protein